MIDLKLIDGKKIGLILWYENKDGKDQAMVHVGTASWNGKILIVKLKNNSSFEVFPEWFDRIKETNSETKKILLDSDYCISLLIGDLPEDADLDNFKKTGLKWSQ